MAKKMLVAQQQIEQKIFLIRKVQVMLDSDLAEIYGVSTSRLNEQVNRNIERFPSDFMFQLTQSEWDNLISQFAISSLHGGRRKLPYVFTEQGVASLSGVLKSDTAAMVHVTIMRAFIAMRKVLHDKRLIYTRLDKIERKQLEADSKFEMVFKALEDKDGIPMQGVFFEGQIFDAYELASKIIRSARQSIILIDNYIDETSLIHLTKKQNSVQVILLTKNPTQQLILDVQKVNQQYAHFALATYSKSHDRFLIIDKTDIYHLGASLKDLGKKLFAFSKMDNTILNYILAELAGLMK